MWLRSRLFDVPRQEVRATDHGTGNFNDQQVTAALDVLAATPAEDRAEAWR
jgi:hypothetical protein